jgi:hypothetical protein
MYFTKLGLLQIKLKPILLLVLMLYCALAVALWYFIPPLYAISISGITPFPTSFALYPILEIIYNALVPILCVLGFWFIIVSIGKYELGNLDKDFRRIGLTNAEKETPQLKNVSKDKSRKNGLIYNVDNVCIPITTFNSKTDDISIVINSQIHHYEPNGHNSRETLIYATPYKYVSPTIIAEDNDFLTAYPNLLCVGKTGAGKSYALTVILGQYANCANDVSITICDYKKSSFAQFEDTPNFYGYKDVPNGIRAVYKEFSERLEANDTERNAKFKVLLIDEYGALISALTTSDKKEADEIKSMVAEMLFMGRSLGIRVIIGIQRADSKHFGDGARDQFVSILALGNLSKTQKEMLFADEKDRMTVKNKLGEGYLHIDDGRNIERVRITPIKNFDRLDNAIRQCMIY